MGMSAFGSRFPEIAARETRSIKVIANSKLPIGHYGFIELYCDEEDCDCRRAMLEVVSETPTPKVWATINFGWESAAFYARWMGDPESTEDIGGAKLDPFTAQSMYADVLLDYFVNRVVEDAYIQRLKRHYRLFKSTVNSRSTPNVLKVSPASKWKPPHQARRRLR